MLIGGISIWGVILSGIASMALGFLWYSNTLFAKPWMTENKFKQEDLEPKPALYVFTLILALISAITLNIVINLTGMNAPLGGALSGFILGLGISATTFGTSYLFERKSLKLYLINAGYQVVYLTIAGLIISLFI
jgi:hypothetical protein